MPDRDVTHGLQSLVHSFSMGGYSICFLDSRTNAKSPFSRPVRTTNGTDPKSLDCTLRFYFHLSVCVTVSKQEGPSAVLKWGYGLNYHLPLAKVPVIRLCIIVNQACLL